MSWLTANWLALASLLGVTGVGGVLIAALRIWSNHLVKVREIEAGKRRQSDTVALDLAKTLGARVTQLEDLREADRRAYAAENALCEANLENVRHEVTLVAGRYDGLLQTLRYAPAERYPEIIEEMIADRDTRRRQRNEERGELRNRTQAEISAVRVRQDAAAASG